MEDKVPAKKEEVNSSLLQLSAVEGIKLIALGGIIAGGFLPLDFACHVFHTRSSPLDLLRLSISYSLSKELLKGVSNAYVQSAKAATLKNGVLSQRHNMNELVAGKKNDEITTEETTREINFTAREAATVSGLLGFIDTSATQLYRNKRGWNFQKIANPEFEVPTAKSFQDNMKIFAMGYPICLVRNLLNVGGFFITPLAKEALSNYLPTQLAGYGSILFTGLTIGGVSNLFDIIYKNQIAQADPKTLKAPTAMNVLKTLIKTEGPKSLRRGLGISMFYSTFAYGFIPEAERLVNTQVAPKVEKWISDLSSSLAHQGMFARAKHSRTTMEEEGRTVCDQELKSAKI